GRGTLRKPLVRASTAVSFFLTSAMFRSSRSVGATPTGRSLLLNRVQTLFRKHNGGSSRAAEPHANSRATGQAVAVDSPPFEAPSSSEAPLPTSAPVDVSGEADGRGAPFWSPASSESIMSRTLAILSRPR